MMSEIDPPDQPQETAQQIPPINDIPEPARAALAHTAGVHAGRYRGGIGDPGRAAR